MDRSRTRFALLAALALPLLGCAGEHPGVEPNVTSHSPNGVPIPPYFPGGRFGSFVKVEEPRTHLVSNGVKPDKFLRTVAYPKSKVTWLRGSVGSGLVEYRVRTPRHADMAVRLELRGPVKKGNSHGSGPWTISVVAPYEPNSTH